MHLKLSPVTLHKMTQNEVLCWKTIEDIYFENEKNCSSFFMKYCLTNLNHAPNDQELKDFQSRFARLLAQQSMLLVREYMFKVHGITELAWEQKTT